MASCSYQHMLGRAIAHKYTSTSTCTCTPPLEDSLLAHAHAGYLWFRKMLATHQIFVV